MQSAQRRALRTQSSEVNLSAFIYRTVSRRFLFSFHNKSRSTSKLCVGKIKVKRENTYTYCTAGLIYFPHTTFEHLGSAWHSRFCGLWLEFFSFPPLLSLNCQHGLSLTVKYKDKELDSQLFIFKSSFVLKHIMLNLICSNRNNWISETTATQRNYCT